MRPGLRAAVGVCLVTAAAGAHLKFPALQAERWIELRLDQEPIRVTYRIGLGPKLADVERQRADRDGDHQVSAAEGNAALDARSDELVRQLRVCSGPSLSASSCRVIERREIETVEVDGWSPSPSRHLHFTWTLMLRERARELGAIRLEDSYEVPGVEITEVEIRPPAHAALSLAGEGGRAQGVTERFTWIEARRAPGPRSIIAAWPAPTARSWRAILVLLAGVAAALAWVVWRRRR